MVIIPHSLSKRMRGLSIIKAGSIIGIFTICSRIFGLAREIIIANYFGTSLYAECVNIAFRFPNLFRRSFGEGALTSAFVPIYSANLLSDRKKATIFASQTFTYLALLLCIITALCEIFMPYIILICAPGFANDPEKFDLSVLLCRITTPYLILISLCALFGGILNSNKNFAPFAASPIILSIFIIGACWVDANLQQKSINIAIGVLVGGISQLIMMSIFTMKFEPGLYLMNMMQASKDTQIFIKNFLPEVVSSSTTQLNLFISQALASFIPGTIAILSYADRIYQFPLSIIGICFSTVLLPELSKLQKAGKKDSAIALQEKAIKLGLFLSFGAMAGIISLSYPIIYIIYERGSFNTLDTIKTSEVLAIFSLGLPAYVINKILHPIFYARLDTRSPMRITLVTICINCILNCIFIYFGFGHLGIALGTTISSWINVLLIILLLKKQGIRITHTDLRGWLTKLSLSSIIMYYCIAFLNQGLMHLYGVNGILAIAIISFLILLGATIYISISFLLKVAPLHEIKSLMRNNQ